MYIHVLCANYGIILNTSMSLIKSKNKLWEKAHAEFDTQLDKAKKLLRRLHKRLPRRLAGIEEYYEDIQDRISDLKQQHRLQQRAYPERLQAKDLIRAMREIQSTVSSFNESSHPSLQRLQSAQDDFYNKLREARSILNNVDNSLDDMEEFLTL